VPSARADSVCSTVAFPALPCRAFPCRRYAAGAVFVPPSRCFIEFRNSLENVKVGQPPSPPPLAKAQRVGHPNAGHPTFAASPSLGSIRWSAAAMSAKSPPSRKEREKGRAPTFVASPSLGVSGGLPRRCQLEVPPLHWRVTWPGAVFGARLELTFWYLSGWGDGCYTRQLWR
jgi:hypothetical protein